MIWIFVDHNLVSAPVPVIAIAEVIGRHAEIEAAEPEALAISTFNVPYMFAAKSAGEMSMLPWMIQVVMRIVVAAVVSNPFVVGVYVGRVRMPRLIIVMLRFLDVMFRRMRRRNVWFGMRSRWPVGGNMTSTHFLRLMASAFGRVLRAAMFLREYRERTHQQQPQQSYQ